MDAHPEDRQSVALKLTVLIQAATSVAIVLFAWRRDWENVFLTAVVIALMLVPAFLRRQHRIIVPPEFQFVSALFIFLSLFMGSALDFYYRYWWWDMALHASSGFLLGMVGFLAVFLLNQTDRIPRNMKPGFVCLFAVTFAVTAGVAWEIFEYTMDLIAPSLNMQSGETGVHDTMHDLIVDAIGAVVVAAMGYAYIKTGRYSFIAHAVRGFVRRNPHMVGKTHPLPPREPGD